MLLINLFIYYLKCYIILVFKCINKKIIKKFYIPKKNLSMTSKINYNLSPWIKNNLNKVNKNSHILDLACGLGRHSIYAKSIGLNVIAVDINYKSLSYLKNKHNLLVLRLDIEKKFNWPFKNKIFDAVIVTNYLYRPVLNKIFYSIKPKGFLLYETFSEENIKFGHPKNKKYLLKPGELLKFSYKTKMTVLEYEEIITSSEKTKAIQRLFARKK